MLDKITVVCTAEIISKNNTPESTKKRIIFQLPYLTL